MKKVSILIPVFNSAERLSRTLSSIYAHSESDNLIPVVVDNCSTVDLKSILDRFPRAKYYRNDSNLGRVGNWNKCLQYIDGDFYMFLMAGDELNEKSDIVSNLGDSQTLTVFDMLYVQGEVERRWRKWGNKCYGVHQSEKILARYLLKGTMPWGPLQTWVFPRSALGEFNKNDPSHADIYYICDIILRFPKVKLVDEASIRWISYPERFHNSIDIWESKVKDLNFTKKVLCRLDNGKLFFISKACFFALSFWQFRNVRFKGIIKFWHYLIFRI